MAQPSSAEPKADHPPPISISKADVNALPLGGYEGPVELVNQPEALPAAAAELRQTDLLGFDTETRPSFRKGQNYPVALLQLAGVERVYLFQLLQLPELGPILDILADPGIRKVGVAIHDDIKKLQEVYPLEPAGFVELATYTQQAGVVNTGLRSLAGLLLGIRISKSAQVSNWARPDLTEAQIRYAATDAWASRALYEAIEARGWVPGNQGTA